MLRYCVPLLLLSSASVWATPPSDPTPSAPAADTEQTATESASAASGGMAAAVSPVLERRLSAQQSTIELQQAQIDELRDRLDEQAIGAGELALDRPFSIYGFFDVNFYKIWRPKVPLDDLVDLSPGFVFGNLNLYFDFRPSDSWRVLTEVRLLLNPLADTAELESAEAGTEFERVDVSTYDASAFGLQFNYGSIEIERAQIEWNRYQLFKIRVGLFLTPFGVWNVDHGSPARMMIQSPYLYTESGVFDSKFPERQLGLVIRGEMLLGEILGTYQLTVSNGRGPAATLVDFDTDKGFGGRLTLEETGALSWKLGISAFTSLYSDFKQRLQFAPELDVIKEVTVRSREFALGLDARLRWGPLELTSEFIANWRSYDDDFRPLIPLEEGGLGGKRPDSISWGGYVLTAYQLPFDAVNLKLGGLVGWSDRDDTDPRDDVLEASGMLNWFITPRVIFKLELHLRYWARVKQEERSVGFPGTMTFLEAQLAVAF
jgi:hypothetical protein